MLFPSLTHKAPNGGRKVNLRVPSPPSEPADALLFEGDYRAPASQEFPTTGAAFATASNNVAAIPDFIWTCDEASGNLVDDIAGEPLVPTASPLHDRQMMICDGANYTSKRGIENTPTGAGKFTSNNASLLNENGTSVALVMTIRLPRAPSIADVFMEKRGGGGSGYWLVIDATGRLKGVHYDGAVSISTTNVSGPIADGAAHTVALVVNTTTETVHIISEYGEASTSFAGRGSTNNSGFLEYGAVSSHIKNLQCGYIAGFTGAAAESIDLATVRAFHNIGGTPTAATALTTQSRNSTISGQVSANRVAHFAGGTSAAGCQLPIVWHEHLEAGAGGFGLLTNSARTNLIGSSENKSGWVNTSGTTDNAADGPDGFRSAMQIVAPSNNFQTWDISPGVDSNEYTLSMWVRRIGATDVSFDVRLYDFANATFMADTNFTATSEWLPVKVTGTSGLSVTNLYSYLRVTTLGEGIEFQFVQLNTGKHRGAYIRTVSGAASLVACNYEIDGIAVGELWKGATGEIEISYVGLESDGAIASSYVFDGGVAGTNGNRRMMWLSGYGDIPQTYGYDSTGTSVVWIKALSVGLVDPTTQENTHVIRWDSAGTLAAGGGLDMEGFTDGVKISDDVGTFAGSDSADRIRIGGSRGGTNVNADVVISRFRAWSEERAV